MSFSMGTLDAGLWPPFGEPFLVPLTPRYLDKFVPFRDPLSETVRVDSFSTVAMQMAFDHSESIVSFILTGSSLFVAEVGPAAERMGILKIRPGEAGGLVGGDATALA